MACKLLRDLQEVADCATHPLMREGAKGCMGARLQLKRGELNATTKDNSEEGKSKKVKGKSEAEAALISVVLRLPFTFCLLFKN
jgi:hypothetical protein